MGGDKLDDDGRGKEVRLPCGWQGGRLQGVRVGASVSKWSCVLSVGC